MGPWTQECKSLQHMSKTLSLFFVSLWLGYVSIVIHLVVFISLWYFFIFLWQLFIPLWYCGNCFVFVDVLCFQQLLVVFVFYISSWSFCESLWSFCIFMLFLSLCWFLISLWKFCTCSHFIDFPTTNVHNHLIQRFWSRGVMPVPGTCSKMDEWTNYVSPSNSLVPPSSEELQCDS